MLASNIGIYTHMLSKQLPSPDTIIKCCCEKYQVAFGRRHHPTITWHQGKFAAVII